jgi:histidine decarboxylase
MRTVTINYEYDPKQVINGAVASEFAGSICTGYLNPGTSGQGYISTLKLSVGLVSVDNLDEVTGGIIIRIRAMILIIKYKRRK